MILAAAGIAAFAASYVAGIGRDGGPSAEVAEVVTLPPGRSRPAPAAPESRAPAARIAAESHPSRGTPAPAPASPPHRAAAIPGDRASLARELQRELGRVGCYNGEINGAWTESTRVGMKAFTDRVNASLPVDKPDYVLLALVQSHHHRVCGAACPEGQVLTESGNCLVSAIAAKRTEPSEAKTTGPPAIVPIVPAALAPRPRPDSAESRGSPRAAAVEADARTTEGSEASKSAKTTAGEDGIRTSVLPSSAAAPATDAPKARADRPERADPDTVRPSARPRRHRRFVRRAQPRPSQAASKIFRQLERAATSAFGLR